MSAERALPPCGAGRPDPFARALVALLLLFSFAAPTFASGDLGYDEYVDLVKRVNALADKFAAYETAALSGEARNRFLFERRAELAALAPTLARMNDPAVKRHEYLTPQVADVLNRNVGIYRDRAAYAVDPAAYDATPATGTLKFLHRDSSGRVNPVAGEDDLPEGSDAYRNVVRAAGADPAWTAGMEKRRADAGLAGSATAVLDERSTAETWHYDPARKAVVVSPRAAERKQADPDADIRSVLAHENGHSIMDDLIGRTDDGTYYLGPDGVHYVNEVTNPTTAFVEGWAEFLDAVPAAPKDGRLPFEYATANTGRVKYERETAGEYKELHAVFSTYDEMVSCEGIVALFLKKVAGLREGNERRMFDALRASKAVRLEEFVARFAADQPDQAVELAILYDEATHRKAPRESMARLFGGAVADALPRFLLVDVQASGDDPMRRTVTARRDDRSVGLDTSGGWIETVFGSGTGEVASTRTGEIDLSAWRPLDPESLLSDTAKPPAPPVAAKPPVKPAARKPAISAAKPQAKSADATRVTEMPGKLQKKPIEPSR